MCFHMNHMMLMIAYTMCCFSEDRMRGTRRSARLTGVPPQDEGADARPSALPRAMSSRSNRDRVARDPRRSLDLGRSRSVRGTVQGGMSEDMEVDQRRDGSLGVSMPEEGMGESEGGTQASSYVQPHHYPPYSHHPGYSMGGTSDNPSFSPYPPHMPYPPYYPPYSQYPMYPPPPPYTSTANPTPGDVAPPPPPVPTVPETQVPKPTSSGGSKVKMTDYMKLGAPQYRAGDDPFEYLSRVKTITDEIGADDSRAIQMAGFTCVGSDPRNRGPQQ